MILKLSFVVTFLWLAAPCELFAQEVSNTAEVIGRCEVVDPLCKKGEGVYGQAINVPSVPRAVTGDPPACGVANCANLSVQIPAGTVATRIVLTVSANGVPGSCATWANPRSGAWPAFGTVNRCAPQTHAAFDAPKISESGRIVSIAFRNWSHTDMRTPYLRVYYMKARK